MTLDTFGRLSVATVLCCAMAAPECLGQVQLGEPRGGACEDCLSLELVSVLGSEHEDETLTMSRAVIFQPPDRVLIAQRDDGIKVFTISGQYLGELGRAGRGPSPKRTSEL